MSSAQTLSMDVNFSGENSDLLKKLKWLTSEDAFRYLGLASVAVLRNLVSERRIPFYKPFGRLLFKRSELDKLVEASRNGDFKWR